MIFCIFSYNRGHFLDNCVRSIERCAEYADICVFDDGSDDQATQRSLSEIKAKYTVIYANKNSNAKHGGLYNNMQRALDICSSEPIVCFLQDDVQLVRPIKRQEIDAYQAHFDKNPRHGFMQPCFLKGAERLQETQALRYNEAKGVYQRHVNQQSAGTYYSDIFVASPSRLIAHEWSFDYSEPKNNLQAKEHFDRLGQMFAPFAMWLPNAPAYRGKCKTLALRIAENRRQCAFNPYNIMTETEVIRLKSRSPDVLPFAEDYLTCVNSQLPLPWSYYPLQGSRLFKKFNSYELFLRRMIGGF